MKLSQIIQPSMMKRENVFKARQYGRDAFNGLLSPILNVDWFEMKGPTFPAHPHAGFSAVTYMFEESKGGFRNRDSLGADLEITPGEVHWSKAAAGMVHEEMPLANDKAATGLQIFVNLPESHQLDSPGAYHVYQEQITKMSDNGVSQRIAVNGTKIGAEENAIPSPIFLGEISLDKDSEHILEIPANWGGILINLDGQFSIDNNLSLTKTDAVAFHTENNGTIKIASTSGARIAVIKGEAFDQPVYQNGPMMFADEKVLYERQLAFKQGEFGTIPTT